MEKTMRCFNRFFLGIACLLNISVEVRAQEKCTECPTLNNPTPVCTSEGCSIVAKGCELMTPSDQRKTLQTISGTPAIDSKPPVQSTRKNGARGCSYQLKNSHKTITFEIKK